jgi:hypothetical protein
MAMRLPAIFATVSVVLVSAFPALAWTPPAVGIPCHVTRNMPVDVTLIAGNYLGGRAHRNGVVDRKSFQACFRDVASCENWIAKRAGDFPLQPGIATCTPVRIGGRG